MLYDTGPIWPKTKIIKKNPALKKLEMCWTLLFSASIVNLEKYGRKEISQRKNTRNGKQSMQTRGINFEKSSKAMEAEGAVMLFSRSVEKLGLQYTSFIADGDSATYREILRARPYGSSVTIVKKECVGHIQ